MMVGVGRQDCVRRMHFFLARAAAAAASRGWCFSAGLLPAIEVLLLADPHRSLTFSTFT